MNDLLYIRSVGYMFPTVNYLDNAKEKFMILLVKYEHEHYLWKWTI